MYDRRRKLWGWGFEDQQPSFEEIEQVARGAREHLGFEPAEVERPPRLEEIELPPPRVEPPSSLAEICSSEPYERITHAYGKAYRDLVRALRGRIDHPPDVVARPRDEREVEQVLAWCADAGRRRSRTAAAPAVVGGVEPRVPPGGRGHDRPGPARSRAGGRRRSRAARIQGGATGPAPRGAAQATRPHPAPLSRSRSSTRRWAAGSPPARAVTSQRSHTHIDDFVESVRALTPSRRLGEPRRRPGSGAGPSPDRLLIGSEGILGVITEAWVRVRPRPALQGVGDGAHFDSFEQGADVVRAIAQSGLSPSNCRLLDPRPRASSRARRLPAQALLVLGFEGRRPSGRRSG